MKHADEHFIPGTSRITEIESFHRYHAAAAVCRECRVLDAACGEGYGSAILASQAGRVWGIDQNEQAVREAAVKYNRENLSFLAGDVEEMPFEAGSFDRVVSFETIEHLIDQKKFLSEVRRVLTPDGVLILSCPNKTPFRARNKLENQYHINELEPERLCELIREFFPHTAVWGQDAFYNSVISGEGENSYFVRDGENNVLQQQQLDHVQYTIITASAGVLPRFAPSCFVDAVYHPEKGYLWDDESVPHQFGLRGEFERQYAELTQARKLNETLSRDNEQKQQSCEKQAMTIEELQQTNKRLDEERENKAAENLQQAKIIENVQFINQRLCEANNAETLRSRDLLAQVEELRQNNNALTEENLQWKNLKSQQELAIEELKSRHDLLSGQCQLQSEENLRQAEFIKSVQLENQRLSKEIALQSGQCSELQNNIQELQQINLQLNRDKDANVFRCGEQEKIIAELQNRNRSLAEEMDAEKAEIRRKDGFIESVQLENQRLSKEIALQSGQCTELQNNIQELQQINLQLNRDKEANVFRCGEQEKIIAELQIRNRSLAEEMDAEKAEIRRKDGFIESVQLENQRLSKEIALQSGRCTELQNNIQELQQINTRLNRENNFNLQLCVQRARSIEELKTLNRSLCHEKEKQTAENNRLTDIISQVEQINKRLSDENCSRLLENRELLQMIAQVKHMNEQLTKEQRALDSRDQAQQQIISELQQHLSGLRQSLEEKAAAMDALRAHCDKITAENQQLQAKVQELTIHWLEEHQKAEAEHDKSEYLWGEWQEVKRSLSFRLIGQYKIRRRIFNSLRSAAGMFFTLFHKAAGAIPMSYPRREAFKEMIFSRSGTLLENVAAFQTWKKHTELRKQFSPRGDTGLIMPREIPLTSIIIPVYNNLEWTKRCVNSICNIKSRSPFEIIIVDDCSTEDYSSLKKDFPKVRLLRNKENLGFLRTVNYGASEAAGEYILILNNDTEVLPNWLDELTAALYNHPEAGMIGSQLIHLNTGTLQESGNLICKNGDMMPLGRGAAPDHPQFTYFREVDFCSAASIILRKKVFDEMEGFDKLYIPAYFEDPDLGLRMQKAGYKNYVCPLSRVIHQEMASYGDVLAEKCEKNRRAFLERWSSYLQEHSLYADRNEPEQCMKFDRERVLFIDAETPMADRGSGGMDSIFFMEYLIKRNCHVVFHGEYTPGFDPKYTSILLRMGVECIYQPYHKIWEYLASTGWSFTYLFVCRIYQARCFDRLLKQYCPQASYIFDTVDVHFVREALEAELKNDDELRKNAAATKEYELAAAAAADAAIVISSDEKKLLENEYHLTNVYHIPQARELFGLAPNPNRRGAVFIGSAHPPNLDGLRYFHDEILPLLPKDFKLTIIGESLKVMIGKSDEYKDLLKCRQFNFVGFVQDLATELDKAKLTVAPLRYGAGTKGKVASSMAYGVPCVSSSFGTEGTGMLHGENIMIAKTPQEFAGYIRELSTDQELWQKISDGGVKFIKDNYAPEAVEKMMDDLFAKVKERRNQGLSNWAATPVMPKVDEL